MVGDDLVNMEAWALLANVNVVHHILSQVCHRKSNLIFSLSLSHVRRFEQKRIKTHHSKLTDLLKTSRLFCRDDS